MKYVIFSLLAISCSGYDIEEIDTLGQKESSINVGIDYEGGVNGNDVHHGQCVYEGEMCIFPAPNPLSFYEEKRRATGDNSTGWAGEFVKNTAREYADDKWANVTEWEFFPTSCIEGVSCLQILVVNNENISGNLGTGDSIFVNQVLSPVCVSFDQLVEGPGMNVIALACKRWELRIDVGSFTGWLAGSSNTVKQQMMNQLYAHAYGVAIGHGATNGGQVGSNNIMHYKLQKSFPRTNVDFTQICSSYQLWLRGSAGQANWWTGPTC